MPKRSSKKPGAGDQTATFDPAVTVEAAESLSTDATKDPAAVALGRKGGLKGGKARAASLSKKRRVEIARGAAKARWKEPV
jgi:hypothetical protein